MRKGYTAHYQLWKQWIFDWDMANIITDLVMNFTVSFSIYLWFDAWEWLWVYCWQSSAFWEFATFTNGFTNGHNRHILVAHGWLIGGLFDVISYTENVILLPQKMASSIEPRLSELWRHFICQFVRESCWKWVYKV